jgi:hypothetical protein
VTYVTLLDAASFREVANSLDENFGRPTSPKTALSQEPILAMRAAVNELRSLRDRRPGADTDATN